MKSGGHSTHFALTGMDKFILALEQQPAVRGNTGNVCHYLLELEIADPAPLRALIESNKEVAALGSLRLSGLLHNSNTWISSGKGACEIRDLNSDELFPTEVLSEGFKLQKPPLLRFYLVQRSSGTVALIMTWHHLLMDGFGATLLLKALAGEPCHLSAVRSKSSLSWKNLREARKAKRFVDRTSAAPLCSPETQSRKAIQPVLSVISFTRKESIEIDMHARAAASRFGVGNYLLAAVTQTVNDFFPADKGSAYWIPVPQDSRKKGAGGPVIGNHLSFLFYRIPEAATGNIPEIVGELDRQMMDQIREKIPAAYQHLLNFLRRVNPSVYYRMVRRPGAVTISSFLFTTAPDHPESLSELAGAKIRNAINLPPNSYPPGLTVSINRFRGELSVIVQSQQHLLEGDMLREFCEKLRSKLLSQKG